MENNLRIAGYCRISLDDEMDRDNVSVENQKTIIRDFVEQKFPGSTLTFFEDRDRSGYTLAPWEPFCFGMPDLAKRKGGEIHNNEKPPHDTIFCRGAVYCLA